MVLGNRHLSVLIGLALAFAASSALAGPPPGFYDSVDTTDAATLRTTLHEVIDDHTRFPYTECERNSDCDDGLYCNGSEFCDECGLCQAGTRPCGDFDCDGDVDAADLAEVLAAWGPHPDHPADFNGDDVVDAADLAELLAAWGVCG